MLHYQAFLKSRARQLRRDMTDSEFKLWEKLRRKQVLGVQFYRQRPAGYYILDFYAPVIRLAIEIDGGQHYEALVLQKDAKRTKYLNSQGIEVIRFHNLQVLQELESVMEAVFEVVAKKLGE